MDDDLRDLERAVRKDLSDDNAFARYLAAAGRGGKTTDIPNELCDLLHSVESSWSDLLKRRIIEVGNAVLVPLPELIFAGSAEHNTGFVTRSGLRLPLQSCPLHIILEPEGIYQYAQDRVHQEHLLEYREDQGLSNPGIFELQGINEYRPVPVLSSRQIFKELVTSQTAWGMLQAIHDWQRIRDGTLRIEPALTVAHY
ncbi:hypothetical protein J4219_09075 [Candidatus Woesearchaeota archaeon]|nr:hypothetical protein [Candidatus Woesearchaeota archaeon]